MSAADKITGIRERLDAIAPLPEDGQVTARELARYMAVRAQERFSKMLHPAAEIDGQQIAAMGAEFAAAHALLALADYAPGPANDCASQARDAICDGGGIGEWLWEHLGGETAQQVAGLAEELAAAQAELAAEGAKV